MRKVVSLLLIISMLTISATSAFASSSYVRTNGNQPEGVFTLYLQCDGPGHLSYYCDAYNFRTAQSGINEFTLEFEVYYVDSSGNYHLDWSDYQIDTDYNFDLHADIWDSSEIPTYGDEYDGAYRYATFSFECDNKYDSYYNFSVFLEATVDIG